MVCLHGTMQRPVQPVQFRQSGQAMFHYETRAKATVAWCTVTYYSQYEGVAGFNLDRTARGNRRRQLDRHAVLGNIQDPPQHARLTFAQNRYFQRLCLKTAWFSAVVHRERIGPVEPCIRNLPQAERCPRGERDAGWNRQLDPQPDPTPRWRLDHGLRFGHDGSRGRSRLWRGQGPRKPRPQCRGHPLERPSYFLAPAPVGDQNRRRIETIRRFLQFLAQALRNLAHGPVHARPVSLGDENCRRL